MFIKDRPVSSFLGASFSSFGCFVFDLGCFVFEFWVLRFRVLGASFSSFGCFVFEFWVLRASVFVFECFVFETTLKVEANQNTAFDKRIVSKQTNTSAQTRLGEHGPLRSPFCNPFGKACIWIA